MMNARALYVFLALAGCGASNPTANRDPRCLADCPETMPPTAGVGDVCSESSRVQCLDECEARIAMVSTVCANCLLENATFAPVTFNQGGGGGGGTCTATGWNGTCPYTCGDNAAYMTCLLQVSPRRTVDCTAKFRPTTECSSLCN
jgi:hypothetical protein